MIEYIDGDIFDARVQTIVNPVNTMGVMGKGLALEFKNKYPEMFKSYHNICANHQFAIGQLMLFRTDGRWVLLFPTKENWRNPSRLEYIEAGLQKFVENYERKGITSIAFPKLGCGNGGLDWDDVRQLMVKYLDPLPIPVFIVDQ